MVLNFPIQKVLRKSRRRTRLLSFVLQMEDLFSGTKKRATGSNKMFGLLPSYRAKTVLSMIGTTSRGLFASTGQVLCKAKLLSSKWPAGIQNAFGSTRYPQTTDCRYHVVNLLSETSFRMIDFVPRMATMASAGSIKERRQMPSCQRQHTSAPSMDMLMGHW